MSEKSPHLKTQNLPVVALFVIWCIALYIAFQISADGPFSHIVDIFSKTHAKDSIFMVLSPLIVVVLSGIVSSDNKARIVFLRVRNALPGHRAFSRHALADPRIDMDKLREKILQWPDTPETENRTWYKIYKKHASAKMVQDSHRAFLLSRDLATISFLFFLVGPWGLLATSNAYQLPIVYSLVMLGHYFVFMLVAQNHGRRFVCNVLAEHTTSGGV